MDVNLPSDLISSKPPSTQIKDLLAQLRVAGTVEAEVVKVLQDNLLLRSRLGDILTRNTLNYKPGDRLSLRLDESGREPVLKVSQPASKPARLDTRDYPELTRMLPAGRPLLAQVVRVVAQRAVIQLAQQNISLPREVEASRGDLLRLERDPGRGQIEVLPLQRKTIYKSLLKQLVPRAGNDGRAGLVKLLDLVNHAANGRQPSPVRSGNTGPVPASARPATASANPANVATQPSSLPRSTAPTAKPATLATPISPTPRSAIEPGSATADARPPRAVASDAAQARPGPGASRLQSSAEGLLRAPPAAVQNRADIPDARSTASTPPTLPDRSAAQQTARERVAKLGAGLRQKSSSTSVSSQTDAPPPRVSVPRISLTALKPAAKTTASISAGTTAGATSKASPAQGTTAGASARPTPAPLVQPPGIGASSPEAATQSTRPAAPATPVMRNGQAAENAPVQPQLAWPGAAVEQPAAERALLDKASPLLQFLTRMILRLPHVDAASVKSLLQASTSGSHGEASTAAGSSNEILRMLSRLSDDRHLASELKNLLQAVTQAKSETEPESMRNLAADLLAGFARDGAKLAEQGLVQNLLQRAALGLQQETQQPLAFNLALPLFEESEIKPLYIDLAQRQQAREQNDKCWDIRISFEFAQLGPVSCHIVLEGEAVAASFYSQQEVTRSSIDAALPLLRRQLTQAGFDPGEFHSFSGSLDLERAPVAGSFAESLIDIEV